MAQSNRLRLALFLLALLPGLLFRGGESLRYCLHDWLDWQDGCTEMSETLAASDSPCGSCCSEGPARPDLPVLSDDFQCQGCCIEIRVERAELTHKSSIDSGVALCPPAPVQLAAVRWCAPPVHRLAPPAVVLTGSPPGRAPTPLRI